MSERYIITYQQKKYDITMDREGDVLTVTHEGHTYSVEVEEKHVPTPSISPLPSSGGAAAARPTPPTITANAGASNPPAVSTSSHPSAASGTAVAPMTGTIKSIHVATGDSVGSGQLLITMEAMKMDIQVNAPSEGTVQKINIAIGDSVQQNAPLMVLV